MDKNKVLCDKQEGGQMHGIQESWKETSKENYGRSLWGCDTWNEFTVARTPVGRDGVSVLGRRSEREDLEG